MTTQNVIEIHLQKYNEMQHIISQFEKLTDIEIALSSEHSTTLLLEKILLGAISLTNADGGTIYRVLEDSIKIEIIHSNSLGIHLNGDAEHTTSLPHVALFDSTGAQNLKMW